MLAERGLVSFELPPESVHKLESIISSVTGTYFNTEIYKTNEEKAVAHMFLIIKDHVFPDGNKRTASLVFEILCDLNNIIPDYGEASLDAWAVLIEKLKDDDHQMLIEVISGILFKK